MRLFWAPLILTCFWAGAAAADCRDSDSFRQIDKCTAALNTATTDSARGEAFLYRCQAYDTIGQHRVALEDCRDAEKALPRDGSVYNSLSIVHQNLENWTSAVGFARIAVSLNASNSGYWNTLSNAYCKDGDIDKSVEARLKAMDLGRFTPRRLQELLQARGYYNGALDGAFGSASRAALRSWTVAGC